MTLPDALSRRPDLLPEGTQDTRNETLLPDSLFIRTIRTTIDDEETFPLLHHLLFINMIDIDLRDHIRKANTGEPMIVEAIQALKKKGPLPIRSKIEDWLIDDGLLFYKGACYIPDDKTLRKELLQQYHDSPMSGHPGQQKTEELI
jgi:hypothetical protein